MSDSENEQTGIYDDDDRIISSTKRKRIEHDSDSDESSAGYRKSRRMSKAALQKARPRGGPSHITNIPLDDLGNPYDIENDEVVLPEDVAGEKKVTRLGYLNGGREYRCRTFTILGRGQRLYMLSTEPARCMGFRDSYLFLQKHKKLYKMIMDDDEKFDMIRRDIIPHSYKGRAIGVITARSIFREFGAKIIVGGRRIIDDYYEGKARSEGAVYGELADPDDKLPPPGIAYNRNQYVAWHGASSVYHTQPAAPTPVFQKKKKVLVTQENWMYEHAKAASGFNQMLHEQRAQHFRSGIYEPHTNVQMFAAISQPSRIARWSIVSKNNREDALIEICLECDPITIPGVGLRDVDSYVYEGCSDDVKEAIRKQQEVEKAIEAQYSGGEALCGLRATLKVT